MQAVSPEVSSELAQLLSNLVLGDNEIRKSAEQAVDERLAQSPELYVLALAQFARMADTEVMRSFSLVLLRRLLFRPMPFAPASSRQVLYDHLGERTRETVERLILSCIQNETDEGVRRKVADTACDLAKGSLERGRPWEALQVQSFTATRSQLAGQREVAYRIFTYVPQLALGQEMNAVIDVYERGLQDPESLQVRADPDTKVRAGRLMILMLDVSTNTMPPLSTEHLPPFINAVIALASTDPSLFEPHLRALLAFLPPLILPSAQESLPTPTTSEPFPNHGSVADTKDEHKEASRRAAIELMVTLSEAKPSMVKKVDGWVPILIRACLEGMGEVEESPDWESVEPTEESEEFEQQVFEHSLDRAAIALGGKVVLPEGTAKIMANELGRIVMLVTPLFQDTHPRVRWAACQCIGQLCSDLEDALQDQFHEQVLAVVHSHAAAAIINFCEGVEPTTLKPYLDLLVPRLLHLLTPGNKRYVQEGAITSLAMVADASETIFQQYYTTLMPLLLDILRNGTGAEHAKLRCKAMECGGLVAIAVGREMFKPDSQQFIELLMAAQNGPQASEPTFSHYVTATWGKLCQALGADFAPLLPVVMPSLLQAASAKADIEVLGEDDVDTSKYSEDNGWEVLDMDGQQVAIRTSALEEKVHATEMLVVYSSTLGSHFGPYVTQTLEIALPGLRFYFHDGVREASAMLLPLLLATAKTNNLLTEQIAHAVLTQVCAGIAQEHDSSFLQTLYKCFTDATKVLGGRTIVPQTLCDDVLKATQNHLQLMAQRRKSRMHPDEDDAEDIAYLEENEDFTLEEMGKMIKFIFDPNHPLLIAISSVKDLSQRQHWDAA
ncbi:ARM repeat-containing protein [Auriculariales sp. MPI-PUGE-AT-0066]|nr:ARM repeat-containing protein [Auriculariales sp. MPI-PUGE-AT-0066]